MELPVNDPFSTIQEPTLLINQQIVEDNLARILAKTRARGIRFRPHMKTHQHPEVGRWIREAGVERITVSSLDMAIEHARLGWTDITIALPCHTRQIQGLADLSSQVKLQVILDNPFVIKALDRSQASLGVWIELDTGANRTGVPVNDVQRVVELLDRLDMADLLECHGFLWHDGHQYAHQTPRAVQSEWQRSLTAVQALKKDLGNRALSFQLSAGDTPSASQVEDLSDVDEIRAGNLVYYDLMQWQAGHCSLDQIGICLAAPVIGHYPNRHEIVVHGGAVHLSKDRLSLPGRPSIYGMAVLLTSDGWAPLSPTAVVTRLSQEHGVITLNDQELELFPVGSLIGILPVHSCLTADAMRHDRHVII